MISSAKGLSISVPTVSTKKESGFSDTSWMGTACDTTSQESLTKTVVRLEANRDMATWIARYMGGKGTLNVSTRSASCALGREELP